LARALLLAEGMNDTELAARLDQIDERFNEIQQLIKLIAERHAALSLEKTQKIVLTEVRGLSTKFDRLTKSRHRQSQL